MVQWGDDPARDRFGICCRFRLRGWSGFGEESQREDRTPARRASHDDVPAHETREFARNREAETGAAELAGRRSVCLGEGFKQADNGLLIHSDAGIRHRDGYAAATVPPRRDRGVDIDAAGARELDGVGNEVRHALADTNRIIAEVLRCRQVA